MLVLEQIEQIRTWGKDNHIDMQKICVVGSAVMELYGIRDAHNFNSGVDARKIQSVPDTIEIFYGDYCLNEEIMRFLIMLLLRMITITRFLLI